MTKQTTPASFPRNRGACGTVQVILEQSADFAVASVVDVSGRLPSEFAPQCGRGSLPTLRQQPHLERLVPAGDAAWRPSGVIVTHQMFAMCPVSVRRSSFDVPDLEGVVQHQSVGPTAANADC